MTVCDMKPALKIIGVIPTRLASKRLPGKILLDIAGRPMLYHVYTQARRSPLLTDLVVATEDVAIRDYCNGEGFPVVMTGRHASGTDRAHEVMTQMGGDVCVNIQGDEPTLRPEHLAQLLGPFAQPGTQVATLKIPIDGERALNPNIVKVVTDESGHALSFSRRSPLIDMGGKPPAHIYKHIGLYAYTRQALARFRTLPQSPLELAEKLEQMRFLENGIPIVVAESPFDTISVDTEDDLRQVTALFGGR